VEKEAGAHKQGRCAAKRDKAFPKSALRLQAFPLPRIASTPPVTLALVVAGAAAQTPGKRKLRSPRLHGERRPKSRGIRPWGWRRCDSGGWRRCGGLAPDLDQTPPPSCGAGVRTSGLPATTERRRRLGGRGERDWVRGRFGRVGFGPWRQDCLTGGLQTPGTIGGCGVGGGDRASLGRKKEEWEGGKVRRRREGMEKEVGAVFQSCLAWQWQLLVPLLPEHR
jgi:hypothetical protein